MSFKLGNLVATQESLGIDLSEEEMDAARQSGPEITDSITEAESDLGMMDGASEAITDASVAVNQISEMQDAVADGGAVSTSEVVALESFHASIMQSLGLPYQRLTLESHRVITRESLVATLEEQKVSIIDRIANGVKSIVSFITGFIAKLLRNQTMLSKYLLSIKESIQRYNTQISPDAVKSGFADAGQASGALQACGRMIATANDAVSELQRIEVIKSGDTNELKKMVAELNSRSYDQILGGAKLMGGSTIKFREGETLVFKQVAGETSITQGKRLTQQECNTLINQAINSLKTLGEMKKAGNIIVNAGKVLMSLIKAGAGRVKAKVQESQRNTVGKEEGDNMTAVNGAHMFFRLVAMMFGSRVPTIVFKNIKAVGDYVRASVG